MRKIVKKLVVAGAMAVAGSVNADVIADLNPYVGVEYQQSWMHGKGIDGASNAYFKDLLTKTYLGASAYIGNKFNENLGLELGADWSGKKKKRFATAAGTLTTKARILGGHLDVVGFMPIADRTELFASMGAGILKPKVESTLTANGVTVALPYTSKSKVVARLGVGAHYMITASVGVRGKLGWENTAKLRLKDAQGATYKAFKNASTAAIGAFARF